MTEKHKYYSCTSGGCVHVVDGKPTCPNCTKITKYLPHHDLLGSKPVEVIPVFLVRRTNTKIKDWFWGCPNFPKCRYSKNRPKTQEEIKTNVRIWANSLYAPNT